MTGKTHLPTGAECAAILALCLRIWASPVHDFGAQQKKVLLNAGNRALVGYLFKEYQTNGASLSDKLSKYYQAEEGCTDLRCAFPSDFCPGCAGALLRGIGRPGYRVLVEGNKLGKASLVGGCFLLHPSRPWRLMNLGVASRLVRGDRWSCGVFFGNSHGFVLCLLCNSLKPLPALNIWYLWARSQLLQPNFTHLCLSCHDRYTLTAIMVPVLYTVWDHTG
jgi:hypothetical protein